MSTRPLRVLVVTAMYPHAEDAGNGVFVKEQMDSLSQVDPRVRVDVLHMQGRRRLRYVRGAAQVFRATWGRRYQVVHAHYGLAALPALFRVRTPLVVSLHGSDVNIRWQRALSRLACRGARGVIVQTRAMQRLLGLPGARVLPVGIDLALFQPLDRAACRATLGLPADAPIVLFPADPRRTIKRYDLFQQALAVLTAGGRVAQVLTLPAGQYPHARMPIVFNACDVLVLTSDSEGSPVVVKEALACNLPIVSVDVGDVAELIGDAAGCAIVPRDPVAIAAAIGRALDRDGRRAAGRARVLHLDQAETARRILQLYADVTR